MGVPHDPHPTRDGKKVTSPDLMTVCYWPHEPRMLIAEITDRPSENDKAPPAFKFAAAREAQTDAVRAIRRGSPKTGAAIDYAARCDRGNAPRRVGAGGAGQGTPEE